MKYLPEELISTKYLDEILGSFCKATGLHAKAVNNEGDTFFSPTGLNQCDFCARIRQFPQGKEKCRESYQIASKEAAKWNEPYFFRCHAGLVIWAVPIFIQDTSIGSIICGQVLLWEADDFFWQEISMMNSSYPDLVALKEAAQKLDVISVDRTQAVADMLFVVVSHMVKRNIRVLEEIEAAKEVQRQIRQEIEERKNSEKKLNYNYDAYLKKERKLLRYIRLGDQTRANKTLNSLLTDLFSKAKGDKEEIRTRVYELACLVSRAAVEGGADAERAMESLHRYSKEFNQLMKIEEIFFQAERIVAEFIEEIFALAAKKHLNLVKVARDFIVDNYSRPIKLNDIADHLFISPSHLSRLFRQELNCTVLEYITRVRVEEAVELMKKQEYSLEQVAQAVGYHNQSHFARVFKKYIGTTPLAYRNSLY